MFTRGPYYRFSDVLDQLVPSKTQFRPQNLEPRHFNKALGSIFYWQGTILPMVLNHPLFVITMVMWFCVTVLRRNEDAIWKWMWGGECPTVRCFELSTLVCCR